MEYETYQPDQELSDFVKCFWTLRVPAGPDPQKQRIVPDGCVEMIFMLGDDVRRYINETDHIIQPRAMILGQLTEPLCIEPTGAVDTFAVRFFPGGFIPFTTLSMPDLENTETDLSAVFGEEDTANLKKLVVNAANTEERIQIVQTFLAQKLRDAKHIDRILRSTVDLILASKGRVPVGGILQENILKRRQLERRFSKLVGLSPKQLARIVRLQTTLQMLLSNGDSSLTSLAIENEYYDQAHFIKDFREFTGTNPNKFLKDNALVLSTAFYQKE
ncbi:helix-turn-helix domain-containing protein [Dyadobacter sp. CY343]|uniref:AraC family transcriptional regulator n=1 Tax=Dyadobacter sp. CY343 TaxID=2907299 RepID=UPI001F30701B|nr:helix-turn-helix domain-containing protein [Dyadobacter sp. CY343]MCE7062140.1 helix-turn-helix domain-containing protein [Dyadobacter sp. CY343]